MAIAPVGFAADVELAAAEGFVAAAAVEFVVAVVELAAEFAVEVVEGAVAIAAAA